MTGTEILVTAGGVGLIAGLAYFFFGPKEARRAEVRGGVQELEITVKGGYTPNLIRVQEGVPLRLVFDRQENSDCSARVVFPDFGVSKSLAAFGRTVVELMPARAGEFGFACGMNMLHGTLVVEEGNGNGSATSSSETTHSTDVAGPVRQTATRITRTRSPEPSAGDRSAGSRGQAGSSSTFAAAASPARRASGTSSRSSTA